MSHSMKLKRLEQVPMCNLSCHATGTSDVCDSPSLMVLSLLVRNINDSEPDFSESETYVQVPGGPLKRRGKGNRSQVISTMGGIRLGTGGFPSPDF
jgi:hypothetical protein